VLPVVVTSAATLHAFPHHLAEPLPIEALGAFSLSSPTAAGSLQSAMPVPIHALRGLMGPVTPEAPVMLRALSGMLTVKIVALTAVSVPGPVDLAAAMIVAVIALSFSLALPRLPEGEPGKTQNQKTGQKDPDGSFQEFHGTLR
jgi:hypothetical protein